MKRDKRISSIHTTNDILDVFHAKILDLIYILSNSAKL